MDFTDLVKRITPTLKKITYKLNGHFSFINDEDLYQEAVVHLWQDFREGKLEHKTDSYILQGCYFHLKNYLRSAKIKTNLVSLNSCLDDEEGNTLEEFMGLKNFTYFLEEVDAQILLEECQRDGLTQREREVLLLCAEGLTVREIGSKLNISHVRVVKIRKGLRQKLGRFFRD